MARPPKYKCNESYFNSINTSNKAYLLGFIWADGSVSLRAGLSFSIKKNDISILEFIKKELESDAPIKHFTIKGNDYVRFAINRISLSKDLISLGLGSNKSKNNAPIPAIKKDLLSHFLRGLFDGDGSIWLGSGYKASFTGGYDFLVWLKSLLLEFDICTNEKIRLRYEGNYNSCMIDISHRKNIEQLKRILYADANFYLDRKHKLFSDAEQIYDGIDKNDWKLNGLGSEIKALLDKGLYPKEISNVLGISFGSARYKVKQIKDGKLC